jgi:hypothetical protein
LGLARGMDSVRLHQAIFQGNAIQGEGHQESALLPGQFTVDAVKTLAVFLTVIRRYPDTHQHHAGPGLGAEIDYAFKIPANHRKRECTQTIIASEFYHHHLGSVYLKRSRESVQASSGSFAAHTGVHYRVPVPLVSELLLKQMDPALVQVNVVPGAQTVPQDQYAGICLNRVRNENDDPEDLKFGKHE